MSVFFTEGRGLPAEFKNADMSGFGMDAGQAFVSVLNAPFDFLKGVFIDKPAAERQQQLDLQRVQASTALAMQQETAMQKRSTARTLMYAGAGIAGLIVLSMIMRPRAAPAVAGYRKSRRSKRRSRR